MDTEKLLDGLKKSTAAYVEHLKNPTEAVPCCDHCGSLMVRQGPKFVCPYVHDGSEK